MQEVSAKKIVLARKLFIALVFLFAVFLPIYLVSIESNCQGISLKYKEFSYCAMVADDESEKAKGLSGRERLLDNQAMLFIFDNPNFYGIWMKDMKMDIDIVWLDESKKIVDIKRKVSPSTYPNIFYPLSKSKYVIEFKADETDYLKMNLGDQIYW